MRAPENEDRDRVGQGGRQTDRQTERQACTRKRDRDMTEIEMQREDKDRETDIGIPADLQAGRQT
eukprot:7295835-Alexandrium_andersonii.AAC.2